MLQGEYNPQALDAFWQQRWAEADIYRTPAAPDGRTFYCLDFFPYPSGDGLSVGHGRNYVPTDVLARFHRMRGNAVLHPMGWDAFGLPAENEAIRKGIHPRVTTDRYAANYRRQMTSIGCSYDWGREINSSRPDFYRWTQWFFLLLYRRGLAYRGLGKQWWCPGCRTVLANEQVEAGNVCWRGHSGVYKRDLEQWYFRITDYAEQLLAGLETLDWPDHILAMQRNWIGRSEGVEFEMPVVGREEHIAVYTTRPDTLYGMTFAVLAPEHPLVSAITTPEQRAAVSAYVKEAISRSELDRVSAGRDGVFTGAQAINPANGRTVPVYVADYVLPDYGSGAIMAVPAHDERDFDFARRHKIPAPVVIAPPNWDNSPLTAAYTGAGTMVNSERWNGLPSDQAAARIGEWLEAEQLGRRVVNYRMRDWLISRQRYWGAPIPIVYCEQCGVVPVPEEELPVLLPDTQAWEPGEDGRSPLASAADFVHTTCPQCGRPAQRETDTMDGFACSSWYFLRFVSPHYPEGPFDPAALATWGAPDLYVGGAEHAVMHLLYARFFTHVMADAGLTPFREPFPVLRSQGIMHSRDPKSGVVSRMSKSAGNVVTPDAMAAEHGADALRLYLLFMAPFERNTIWEEDGIIGSKRFLARVWQLAADVQAAGELPPTKPNVLTRKLHRAIRQVTADVEAFAFNTAVSELMKLLNEMTAYQRERGVTGELSRALRTLVLLLAPFAPHLAEELWAGLGGEFSVHQQAWPTWDPTLAAVEEVTLVVQIDGKVRDRLTAESDTPPDELEKAALAAERIQPFLAGRRVERIVVAPGRVVNIVTAPAG